LLILGRDFQHVVNGADVFTSPLKEGVLRIFVALKNLSPSAGIEHTNLGSNGKHINRYTTEDDKIQKEQSKGECCMLSGSDGGEYEDGRLLGCCAA
jgi:hypothetical protein